MDTVVVIHGSVKCGYFTCSRVAVASVRNDRGETIDYCASHREQAYRDIEMASALPQRKQQERKGA